MELQMKNNDIETIMVKLNKIYRDKQEKELEDLHARMQREMMAESSRHYVTKNKLEKEEAARLEAEMALFQERKAHEQTKKEMGTEIARLKLELAFYFSAENNIVKREVYF